MISPDARRSSPLSGGKSTYRPVQICKASSDTICYTTAIGHDLPAKLLPENWRRDPEQDEAAQENAKLKAEVIRLSAAEPKVSLSFRDDAGRPLNVLEATVKRWPALGERAIDALMIEVQQRCPPANSFERQVSRLIGQNLGPVGASSALAQLSAFQPHFSYRAATEDEIERYKTTLNGSILSERRSPRFITV